MCTAISYKAVEHYFGRNLDIEVSFDEQVIITPRHYKMSFKHLSPLESHFAIIGMGIVADECPLYFDGTNEKGLSVAALNFPGNAMYYEPLADKENVASFELIPWILCQCESVKGVKALLEKTNITNTPFNKHYPPTPLHWLISDKDCSITVESTCEGLKIYDNHLGVLTNNPPFEIQNLGLARYMTLTPFEPENNFSDNLKITPYSRGMGAIGLPGDMSSESRFVKACFIKENSICDDSGANEVNQFFHILASVEQVRGIVRLGDGLNEITDYSSCCNTDKGIYYYKTYDNFQINAVNMHKENLDSCKLISYPLKKSSQINYVN